MQNKYISKTLSGDCSFWKDSSLDQLIDLIIMTDAWEAIGGQFGCPTTPICPTTQLEVEFITSSCYKWQKCTYTTTTDAPICDPPEHNPGPAPGSSVDVWTWHDCGVSCCKRTYKFCEDPPVTGGTGLDDKELNLHRIHIDLISKERIIPCTDNSNGYWPEVCNDGC